MIHEIYPHVLDNQFKIQKPKLDDFCIVYNGRKTLLKKSGNASGCSIPSVADVLLFVGDDLCEFDGHYLLNIDGRAFFLLHVESDFAAPSDYEFVNIRTFRSMNPVERMGGATCVHIAHWETLNKFCGNCGSSTVRSEKERCIVCPECGNMVYPRISPVVIIAVHDGDRLLMAHNIDNPNPRMFLISGVCGSWRVA